jgi:hypothetical protein
VNLRALVSSTLLAMRCEGLYWYPRKSTLNHQRTVWRQRLTQEQDACLESGTEETRIAGILPTRVHLFYDSDIPENVAVPDCSPVEDDSRPAILLCTTSDSYVTSGFARSALDTRRPAFRMLTCQLSSISCECKYADTAEVQPRSRQNTGWNVHAGE